MNSRFVDKRIFYYSTAIFLFLQLFLINSSFAQTIIWFESFGSTAPGTCDNGTLANGFITANGTWTVTPQGVNDTAANEWYISATEASIASGSCSTPGCHVNAAQIDRTLHVGNVSNSPNILICPTGDCGAVYDPGGFQDAVETHKRAESPSFPMNSNTAHLLVFNYLEVGDAPVDSDDVKIYFFNGTTWNFVANPPRTDDFCSGSSYRWERYSIALPVITTPANVQIGFLWENDNGGFGISPSFAVDSIFIFSVDTAAGITASSTNICVGQCIDFFADTIGAGATYDWVFNGATPAISNQQNPTNICYPNTGTYTVLLTATKPGFVDTATVTITVNPCTIPNADFMADSTAFCEGGCAIFTDLSTSGATGWTWQFPGGNPSSSTSPAPPQICYSTPGFYDVTLIAYNSFGADTMVKTAYMQVDSCPPPIPDFTTVINQTCPQYCATYFDASSNGPILTYSWTFPGGNPSTSSSPNPSVCYSLEGAFGVSLTVTNIFGSSTIFRDSAVVVQFLSSAAASPDTAMFSGSSYQMNASGGVTYSWTPTIGLSDPDTSGPVASPTQTTHYTVAISDGSGCTALREVVVTILHNNTIFIPNTFSPNDDGRNDRLVVRGNNFREIEFAVFDRWGEKVFESTDPLRGWDGTFNGEDLDPAVFTFYINAIFNDNEVITRSGTVTLVR